MKKFAVIVAGGSGSRMNAAIPKQFLVLADKPVICHTVDAFLNTYEDLQVILVLPKDHLPATAQMFSGEQLKRMQLVEGGATRFESVKNGLQKADDDSIVFVHDGVRCLVSERLIRRCYCQAEEKGNAVPFVYATDTIRILDNNSHHATDRNNIAIIQTPQTFKTSVLKTAFMQEYTSSFTDEATVAEAAGVSVHLIEGEHDNIKITRPIDLLIAERILQQRVNQE